MGKEPQFARAEVAIGVAENLRCQAANAARFRSVLYQFPSDPFCEIGLDLIKRPHHHARQNQRQKI